MCTFATTNSRKTQMHSKLKRTYPHISCTILTFSHATFHCCFRKKSENQELLSGRGHLFPRLFSAETDNKHNYFLQFGRAKNTRVDFLPSAPKDARRYCFQSVCLTTGWFRYLMMYCDITHNTMGQGSLPDSPREYRPDKTRNYSCSLRQGCQRGARGIGV